MKIRENIKSAWIGRFMKLKSVDCSKFRSYRSHGEIALNADETHFVINQWRNGTLVKLGEREVKNADVLSDEK